MTRSGETPGWGGTVAVGLAALILYALTVAPDVVWGDPAKLTLMAMDLEILAGPGQHPGYVALAGLAVRILPGDPALVLNLFSALAGAVGVAFVYRAGRLLQGPWAGTVGAGALAVSHLYWHAAVQAETYAPSSACLAVALWAAVRLYRRPAHGPLILGAGALGLGIGFNLIVAIVAPAFLALLWARRRKLRPTWLAGGVGLFLLLGGAPYLGAALVDGGLAELMKVVGSGLATYGAGPGRTAREVLRYPAYLAYQFPSPVLVLLPLGAWVLWRADRGLAVTVLGVWLLDVVFASSWMRQRQFMILSVGSVPAALLAAAGAGWCLDRLSARVRASRTTLAASGLAAAILLPPLAYAATPPAARALGVDLVGARSVPERDNADFFLRPWKRGHRGPMRFAREVFRRAEPGSVVVADFTISRVLLYAQRQGLGAGVRVFEVDWFIFTTGGRGLVRWIGEQRREGRRVYLADDEPDYYFTPRLKEQYRLEPAGPLLEVVPRAREP